MPDPRLASRLSNAIYFWRNQTLRWMGYGFIFDALAMSDLEAIEKVLVRAARRRRWERAWNGFWHGLFFGALVWLGALALYKLAPIPFSILIGAGIGVALCLAGGFLSGWIHRPTLHQAARCPEP